MEISSKKQMVRINLHKNNSLVGSMLRSLALKGSDSHNYQHPIGKLQDAHPDQLINIVG